MRSDICLSIGNMGFGQAVSHLRNVSLAEVRMDLLNFTDEQFRRIFGHHKNLIATFRSDVEPVKLIDRYGLALDSGCTFVDVDASIPEVHRNTVKAMAHGKGCKVILSYHNFNETPEIGRLQEIADALFRSGADVAKLACKANTAVDCSRVLGLYARYSSIVAFCMGNLGKVTRLAAPILGAPFTYASADGCGTAPGQIDYGEVENFLNRYKD